MPVSVLPVFDSIGVIVGRDLVGDALIKLPFLRALRNAFPQAEISWITSQGPTAFAGQLRDPTRALIDVVYEMPEWLEIQGKRRSLSDLKELVKGMLQRRGRFPPAAFQKTDAPGFDLLIDTRNRWREAILARKIPHRLFLSPAMQFLFSDLRPPFLGSRPAHLCDQLLELVELAAGHKPVSTGALPVAEDIMQKARRILPPGNVYVGVAPGAGNLGKAWPRFKFEKVAFTQAQKGRVPVFILGPQELGWYDELQTMVPSAKFPLQDYDTWGSPRVALEHTLAIGRLLDVAVANDSGVGHMLAAADCPLISLFGPTSADKLAPRVTHGIVIRAQDFGSTQTRAITWEAVNDAVDKLLSIKGSN